jgi:hypothetical protein
VIGAALAVLGVVLPHGDALVALASSIVGGVLGVLQPWRGPAPRTRASDRRPTNAEGYTPVPVMVTDPDKTPTRPAMPLPPGVIEDRRRRDR